MPVKLKRILLPLASLVLAGLCLWLPFPALSALDAALPATAVQENPDLLSKAGQQCNAARRLYAQKQTWQSSAGYNLADEETESSAEEFTAALDGVLNALTAADVLPDDAAEALRASAAEATNYYHTAMQNGSVARSCLRFYTGDDGEVYSTTQSISFTMLDDSLVTGFSCEGVRIGDAPGAIAERYAAYLGGDALTDWRTVDLTLYAESAALYSADGQLYLCVMRDADSSYFSISAGSLTASEIEAVEQQ